MPRGWPKGKPRDPAHIAKMVAGSVRAKKRRKVRAASLSAGTDLGDGGPSRSQSGIDFTPAVWRRITDHVGDCEYVDEELDDVLLRALRERVVYAQSACTHHEPCFQDVTTDVLAAVDKEFRKNGKRASRGLLKNMPTQKPKPKKKIPETIPAYIKRKNPDLYREMSKTKESIGYREGRPLTEVVAELLKGE